VPPAELMRRVSRDLDDRRKRVRDALARLPVQAADRKIYELGDRAQVFERARSMLRAAKRIALLDLGAGPLADLARDLAQTAARGVQVAARTERAASVDGVEVVEIPARGAAAEEPWSGEWLTLVVDGAEYLLAVFSADQALHQGVWSSSRFLAWVYHSGLASEITLDLTYRLVASGAPRSQVRAAVDRLRDLAPADAPGRRTLLSDLRLAPRAD
jgi:hypothetical protein